MSPQVTAAIIAAIVSGLTLIGTLAAQYFGRRATSKQLERTLAEQRTRTLNERFATAAGQLGDDKSAVRLAGVYAMAGLADDWPENRQTCIGVLCAYLRLPYDPAPGDDAGTAERTAYRANREVRHTVIRVITAHLQADMAEAKSWQGLDLDFTGVVFDGGDFSGARYSGGTVNFRSARFSGGTVDFTDAEFPGGIVNFTRAQFSGSIVNFTRGARFSGGTVNFTGAQFLSGLVDFGFAKFQGGIVIFTCAEFSGGWVNFVGAQRSGGIVDFTGARFSGGTVDFSHAGWSLLSAFPGLDTPPAGVKLPRKEDQSQA